MMEPLLSGNDQGSSPLKNDCTTSGNRNYDESGCLNKNTPIAAPFVGTREFLLKAAKDYFCDMAAAVSPLHTHGIRKGEIGHQNSSSDAYEVGVRSAWTEGRTADSNQYEATIQNGEEGSFECFSDDGNAHLVPFETHLASNSPPAVSRSFSRSQTMMARRHCSPIAFQDIGEKKLVFTDISPHAFGCETSPQHTPLNQPFGEGQDVNSYKVECSDSGREETEMGVQINTKSHNLISDELGKEILVNVLETKSVTAEEKACVNNFGNVCKINAHVCPRKNLQQSVHSSHSRPSAYADNGAIAEPIKFDSAENGSYSSAMDGDSTMRTETLRETTNLNTDISVKTAYSETERMGRDVTLLRELGARYDAPGDVQGKAEGSNVKHKMYNAQANAVVASEEENQLPINVNNAQGWRQVLDKDENEMQVDIEEGQYLNCSEFCGEYRAGVGQKICRAIERTTGEGEKVENLVGKFADIATEACIQAKAYNCKACNDDRLSAHGITLKNPQTPYAPNREDSHEELTGEIVAAAASINLSRLAPSSPKQLQYEATTRKQDEIIGIGDASMERKGRIGCVSRSRRSVSFPFVVTEIAAAVSAESAASASPTLRGSNDGKTGIFGKADFDNAQEVNAAVAAAAAAAASNSPKLSPYNQSSGQKASLRQPEISRAAGPNDAGGSCGFSEEASTPLLRLLPPVPLKRMKESTGRKLQEKVLTTQDVKLTEFVEIRRFNNSEVKSDKGFSYTPHLLRCHSGCCCCVPLPISVITGEPLQDDDELPQHHRESMTTITAKADFFCAARIRYEELLLNAEKTILPFKNTGSVLAVQLGSGQLSTSVVKAASDCMEVTVDNSLSMKRHNNWKICLQTSSEACDSKYGSVTVWKLLELLPSYGLGQFAKRFLLLLSMASLPSPGRSETDKAGELVDLGEIGTHNGRFLMVNKVIDTLSPLLLHPYTWVALGCCCQGKCNSALYLMRALYILESKMLLQQRTRNSIPKEGDRKFLQIKYLEPPSITLLICCSFLCCCMWEMPSIWNKWKFTEKESCVGNRSEEHRLSSSKDDLLKAWPEAQKCISVANALFMLFCVRPLLLFLFGFRDIKYLEEFMEKQTEQAGEDYFQLFKGVIGRSKVASEALELPPFSCELHINNPLKGVCFKENFDLKRAQGNPMDLMDSKFNLCKDKNETQSRPIKKRRRKCVEAGVNCNSTLSENRNENAIESFTFLDHLYSHARALKAQGTSTILAWIFRAAVLFIFHSSSSRIIVEGEEDRHTGKRREQHIGSMLLLAGLLLSISHSCSSGNEMTAFCKEAKVALLFLRQKLSQMRGQEHAWKVE